MTRNELTGAYGSSPLARGTRFHHARVVGAPRFIPAGAGNTGTCRMRQPNPAVHPRWRGEHGQEGARRARWPGSSPLARGTLLRVSSTCSTMRFIPAGAGNTLPSESRQARGAVHPRWRGEHMTQPIDMQSAIGSSPLARGTPRVSHRNTRHRRFIPAGAGNTAWSLRPWSGCAVHPRWRGEHTTTRLPYERRNGSSPLARGTQFAAVAQRKKRRFIPAGAGNTSCRRCLVADLRGSSPLARGTPLGRPGSPARSRFIPAGAGNTGIPARLISWKTVHPRWRGEHSRPGQQRARPRRFIPAGAGNTPCRQGHRGNRSVHPRWRGEHSRTEKPTSEAPGSSPLARGTPQQPQGRGRDRRFIPAGAGNTSGAEPNARVHPVHPRWRGEHINASS